MYRAIDTFGDTVDFLPSEMRDEAAATTFFRQTIDGNGLPEKVVINKSGSNNAGLENINMLLMLAAIVCWIEILQVQYWNNRIEQDHRYIKKITKPMMGFKALYSAAAPLAGIETAQMIRKGQLYDDRLPAYKQFMALAA